MRVFITGGGGMVGRNLVDALNGHGLHEVLAPTSRTLNLLDYDAVLRVLTDQKPDAIVHCAGRVGGIQANIAKPAAFLADNLTMGMNVLAAARERSIEHVINLSSTCMYPRGAPNPLSEDMILTAPLEPTNEGYALAKIAVMRFGEYINREDGGERIKTLIPCNIYGRYDSFQPEKSHLVPAILSKMHHAKTTGASEVEIWGTGEARREFMYAGDLADGIVRAIDQFDTLPSLMNIGVGSDYSVNEYYAEAARLVEWDGQFIHDTNKPVGMMKKLCSTALQTEWGWTPKHTLAQGLAKTYEFYQGTMSQ